MDEPNRDTSTDEPHEADESLAGQNTAALKEMVSLLSTQAFEQIDEGHEAFTVAASLSPESLESFGDARTDWHHQYDLGAHYRAMVYRDLWDYGWTALHNDLAENDHAQTLGYDPDMFPAGADAPHRTTLSRAWEDYFGDGLRWVVTEVCKRIRDYARETGNLIGSQTITTEDKTDASPRTEARVKSRKTHEMAEQFRDLFYDELDLNMPDNAYYDKEDLLDLFLHMAFTDDFANDGAKTWRKVADDKRDTPSGDTLRRYIRVFDEHEKGEVSTMFDSLSEKLWQMAERRGYLDGLVDVAIDGHAWLFYGDDETPRISNVDPKRGTDKAYSFLTLSVIGNEGEKFTVGVRQVASKQEKIEAVKELVSIARERLFVGFAMLDREFYEVFYAQALNETGVNYLIRAQRGSKSKKMWENADEDGINVERTEMERSRPPYLIAEVTRFVAPAREKMDYEYIAFITNVEVTRRQAKRLSERYPLRWGIETSYRVTGDFLPKTASKDFALRQFYYRMAVLLYNTWVIVNAVVVETIGHPPEASPPVTAKYLLVVLRNKHDEQGFT